MSCTESGRPSRDMPTGTATAGTPAGAQANSRDYINPHVRETSATGERTGEIHGARAHVVCERARPHIAHLELASARCRLRHYWREQHVRLLLEDPREVLLD